MTGTHRGLGFCGQHNNEVIMKSFKVEINYGRKCPAFETTVQAPNEAIAAIQAKVLAKMSGWSEAVKKITVKGA